MNCNCHHESPRGTETPDISQRVIVPCDPEMLARLQAEYLPQTPLAEIPEPCEIESARQLVHQCSIKLKPGAELLLHDDQTPRRYYEQLLENGYLAEGRRVLAHTLPKRRALWWACLCARDAYQDELPESVERAIEAVTRFVRDPSETNRRDTEQIGRALPPNRLEACLAMAAFFSGGSVSLPHLPAVTPRPFVTGRLVGVSVYLSSVIRSAARYKDHLRQYLAIGVDVARGQDLWYRRTAKQNRVDTACPALTQNGMHSQPLSSCRTKAERKEVIDVPR